ncbi:MAG: hypothetical protein C0502_05140 [Opitutus sp.]|nr:hypothetical protein [Opitutus sp.]
MRKIIYLVFLLNAGVLFGVEDTPENRSREADRYLAATPPKEMFADMAEQVAKTVPPERRQALKDAFTKYLDLEALTKAMRDAMVKNFTADELSALADFYGSPVGKSAMKKFGTYMADVMPAIQGEMMKASAKMNRDLPDEPEKKPNQSPQPTPGS